MSSKENLEINLEHIATKQNFLPELHCAKYSCMPDPALSVYAGPPSSPSLDELGIKERGDIYEKETAVFGLMGRSPLTTVQV